MALSNRTEVDECILLGLVTDGCSRAYRDVEGCTQLHVKKEII